MPVDSCSLKHAMNTSAVAFGKEKLEKRSSMDLVFLSSLLAGTGHGLLCATPNPTESSQC